mmetsp:Transcript_7261/g.17704  ORF Transcript_7261/g.17704 Transcript_7261/m.17704 type:complete len:476 (+) Transcript_7261:75-1502(+)
MTARTLPMQRLKMNVRSNRNNRQMQPTSTPHMTRLDRCVNGDEKEPYPDGKESLLSSTATKSVLELLELLRETSMGKTPTKRKSKKSLKVAIGSTDRDEKRERLSRKHSSKTEPCKTSIRERKPPPRASSSSMQHKSSTSFDIDRRLTLSLKESKRDGMRKCNSLGDKLQHTSLPVRTQNDEFSNCSMGDNSFFQDSNSCLGDFQRTDRSDLKQKKEQEFIDGFGFTPFHAEMIQEHQEEPSEHSSPSEHSEKRRRRSIKSPVKRQHRKLPLRQSSSEGLVLHSSSEISTCQDKDSTRRRRRNCSSAGKIRNKRTNEEYTGFFLTSPGEESLKNGFGISRFSDGRVFEGLYENGRMVQGKMTYPVAYQGQQFVTTYLGKFDEDGLRCGKGIYTTATSTFLGEFHRDEREGPGIIIYHDDTDGAELPAGANAANPDHQRRFVGQFKEGRRHGHGQEILADGTIQQEGLWERGRFTG